jgi:hypothetical protein
MLDEAAVIMRAGSVQQLTFDFVAPPIPPEPALQRLRWEQEILGLPLSVHPLSLVKIPARAYSLQRLPASNGRLVTVYGVRLPGWTGGAGFFLGDGETFVVAKIAAEMGKRLPRRVIWQPMRLRGRWMEDEWGSGWLQVLELEQLPVEGL